MVLINHFWNSSDAILSNTRRPGPAISGTDIIILNSIQQSTGHKEAIGIPTLHIGSRCSEELIPKVKGFTFIVIIIEIEIT